MKDGTNNISPDDRAEALWDEARLANPELRDLPDWVNIHPNKRAVLGVLLKQAMAADVVSSMVIA